MAVAQAAWTAAGTSSTSGTTVSTATAVLTSGNFGIAFVAFDTLTASTPTVSITDNASGSWTQIGTTVRSATFGTGKPSNAIFIRTTVGTGSTMTVTATFSSAITYKVITTRQFSGTAGSVSGITSVLGTSTPPALTTPSATASGDMYVTHLAVNDTSPSGWSGWTAASTGTIGSNPTAESSYTFIRAATASGTTTTGSGNQTGNTATSVEVAFVVFQGVVSTSVESWGILSIN
jgi:hypothetical protein